MAKTASQKLLSDLNQRIGQLENEKSLMAKYMGRLESQIAAANAREAEKDRVIEAVMEELKKQVQYDCPVTPACAKRCVDSLAALLEQEKE